MPDTHVIRLRGPWEYEPLARTFVAADGTRRESTDELPPAGRVHLPSDWGASLGAEFRGRVRYSRRFGLPTNLESHEQVWLVVDGVDYFGTVALNGHALGEAIGFQSSREFDIRSFLVERNLLTLDVDLPLYEGGAAAPQRPGRDGLPGGLIGEIRLEIRFA
jgi:beta-galactosidase/beta-glucuronidase